MTNPLKMPEPNPPGLIPTLNNTGYMAVELDPFSMEFARFSTIAPGPLLDIGAAYGNAVIAALNNGGRVIACDIEPKHLEILKNRVPKELTGRLSTQLGDFPDELNFKQNSLGGVLMARLLHFFDGQTIERSLRKVHEWLAVGGKVFIIAQTPYMGDIRNFLPTYIERKTRGDLWPGFVDDISKFSKNRSPRKMHFLDEDILNRVLTGAGFAIERIQEFCRSDLPKSMQLDGRESVGAVAVKR